MLDEEARSPYIAAALAYMEEHLAEPLSPSLLAARLGLNANYFSKLFKAELGMPPLALLTTYRVERAKSLLLYTDTPVKEVAVLCGFTDALYFSRVFKRVSGLSPLGFRRSARRA